MCDGREKGEKKAPLPADVLAQGQHARALRLALRNWRRTLPSWWRKEADAAIIRQLRGLFSVLLAQDNVLHPKVVGGVMDGAKSDQAQVLCRGRVLGVYWPIEAEPDLRSAWTDWSQIGWDLALPSVAALAEPLVFGRLAVGFDSAAYVALQMARDRCGIPIPQPFERVRPDVLLVPCLGVHCKGYRLGYGGGFFDRTLSNDLGLLSIGIAYEETFLENWDPAPHDQRLAYIVTESRICSYR